MWRCVSNPCFASKQWIQFNGNLNLDIDAQNECGKNYWNNIYMNRVSNIFNYSLGNLTQLNLNTASTDERHNFSVRQKFNNRDVIFRCDVNKNIDIANQWVDIEHASQVDVRGTVDITWTPETMSTNINTNMNPKIEYGYEEHKTEISKSFIDTSQVYYFKIYYPLKSEYTNLTDLQIEGEFFGTNKPTDLNIDYTYWRNGLTDTQSDNFWMKMLMRIKYGVKIRH